MTRRAVGFAAVAIIGAAAACSGSSASPLSASASASAGGQGDEDGRCFTDGTCNAGLQCVASTCAIPVIDGGSRADATSDVGAVSDGASDKGASDGAACPSATILHPGTEKRKSGTTVPFVGKAVDPGCSAITGSKLSWTDNLEGPIGNGTNFDHVFTKLGAHTVTLTGSDGLGGKVTAAISFTID